MRKLVVSFVALAMLLGLAGLVKADTELTIKGQVRIRDEADKRSFADGATTRIQSWLRTRVMVNATVDENAHAVIQFQDSRILGGTIDGSATSGTLNDAQNVDIHQAYMQVDRVFVDGLGFKGGRFEFNMGNQRVFGAVGWDNVGRSWEGGMIWYKQPEFSLTAFGLKRLEVHDLTFNRDFDIFGGMVSILEHGLDFFAFYEVDSYRIGFATDVKNLKRFNFGTYLKRKHQNVDLEANFVLQRGEIPTGMLPTDSTTLDISALMATVELGFSFEGTANARIAAGFDYSSGDADPTDDKFKSYQNSYWTGHKFRGHMDYFLASDNLGLLGLMARGKFDPAQDWTVKADIHLFSSAEDMPEFDSVATTATTKSLGTEIDVSVSTTKVKGIVLMTGFSIFLPSETFAQRFDPNAGVWAYSMASVNF